ncbi:hypothetical protein GOODEAATRI_026465, partial [Goodea atripinnis]
KLRVPCENVAIVGAAVAGLGTICAPSRTPSAFGLQLADEFIRPTAQPRSMAVFGPNWEAIGGALVANGHRPRSLE